MYKVCVYEYVNRAQLKKVDEFKFDGLLGLLDFLTENHPLDPQYEITVDFVKDGE